MTVWNGNCQPLKSSWTCHSFRGAPGAGDNSTQWVTPSKGTEEFQCNTTNLTAATPADSCLLLPGSPRNFYIHHTAPKFIKKSFWRRNYLGLKHLLKWIVFHISKWIKETAAEVDRQEIYNLRMIGEVQPLPSLLSGCIKHPFLKTWIFEIKLWLKKAGPSKWAKVKESLFI